jgi:hypothetical protein
LQVSAATPQAQPAIAHNDLVSAPVRHYKQLLERALRRPERLHPFLQDFGADPYQDLPVCALFGLELRETRLCGW